MCSIDENVWDGSLTGHLLQQILVVIHFSFRAKIQFNSLVRDELGLKTVFDFVAERTEGFADHDDSMRLDRVFHEA